MNWGSDFSKFTIEPLGIFINFCFYWNENEVEYIPICAQLESYYLDLSKSWQALDSHYNWNCIEFPFLKSEMVAVTVKEIKISS